MTEGTVNVFIKNHLEKRIKWMSSRPILSIEPSSGSVLVTVSNGKISTAEIEYGRPEISEDTYGESIQDGFDNQDMDISRIMDVAPIDPSKTRSI